MSSRSCIRKGYAYAVRESLYFRRALFLQPLAYNGAEKEYSPLGMALNVVSLFISMIVSSTCYRTLCHLKDTSFSVVDGLLLHICIGRMAPFFFFVVAAAVLVYYLLLGFSPLESGYVVLYSLSSTLLVAMAGKSIQLCSAKYAETVGGVTLLASGIISSIFVLANRSKQIKGYFLYSAVASVCILVQTIMHILADTSTFGVVEIGRVRIIQ